MNTFKALDGHIAKLLSCQAGQLAPQCPLLPSQAESGPHSLTLAKVRDVTGVLFQLALL